MTNVYEGSHLTIGEQGAFDGKLVKQIFGLGTFMEMLGRHTEGNLTRISNELVAISRIAQKAQRETKELYCQLVEREP